MHYSFHGQLDVECVDDVEWCIEKSFRCAFVVLSFLRHEIPKCASSRLQQLLILDDRGLDVECVVDVWRQRAAHHLPSVL